MRRTLILTVLPVILAAACGTGPESPEVVVASATLPPSQPVEAAAEIERVARAALPRGGTLDGVLRDLNVPDRLRPRILSAFDEHLDLRRLRAGAGVTLTRGDGGEIASLGCRTAVDSWVRLRSDGRDGFHGEVIEIPVETRVLTAGGVVDSSVAQALGDAPLGLELVPAFADVFQWDIDLLVEPRVGDRIRVVYEIGLLGDIGPEVPDWGGSRPESGEVIGLGRILAASYAGAMASATAYWVHDDDGAEGYYDDDGAPLRKTFLKSPLNYRRISSGFSRARRHPITRKVVPHHGVDFAAPRGTPVSASADGRVVAVAWQGALGKAVKIRHGSEYTTIYGHLNGYARGIRNGASVRQGQVVGYVGSTGRATGPHLHYSMLRGGSAINPMTFKNPPVRPLPDNLRPRLQAMRLRWDPVLCAIAVEESVSFALGPDGTRSPMVGS